MCDTLLENSLNGVIGKIISRIGAIGPRWVRPTAISGPLGKYKPLFVERERMGWMLCCQVTMVNVQGDVPVGRVRTLITSTEWQIQWLWLCDIPGDGLTTCGVDVCGLPTKSLGSCFTHNLHFAALRWGGLTPPNRNEKNDFWVGDLPVAKFYYCWSASIIKYDVTLPPCWCICLLLAALICTTTCISLSFDVWCLVI